MRGKLRLIHSYERESVRVLVGIFEGGPIFSLREMIRNKIRRLLYMRNK
jgi:hypothetical protein